MIDGVLEGDLGRPRKQCHTARRIYDRMVSDLGYSGSHSSVCRYVALWRRERAGSSPRDACLELEWAPGTAQADFGNFRCMLAGGGAEEHEAARGGAAALERQVLRRDVLEEVRVPVHGAARGGLATPIWT